MDREIRKKLIECARLPNGTISYSELNEELHLGYDFVGTPRHRKEIGDDLGDVSEFEHKEGRPLLSALVVRKGDGSEGTGFYELCEELGYGTQEYLMKNRKAFDKEQKNRCYEFWQKHENYVKHR
jgi:hypothetical protein